MQIPEFLPSLDSLGLVYIFNKNSRRKKKKKFQAIMFCGPYLENTALNPLPSVTLVYTLEWDCIFAAFSVARL